MNHRSVLQETPARVSASSRTTLYGRTLLAARTAWIIFTLLVVGLSVAYLPAAYSEYSSVCAAGTECRPYWRIAPEDASALKDLGMSIGSYATYRLSAEIVYG